MRNLFFCLLSLFILCACNGKQENTDKKTTDSIHINYAQSVTIDKYDSYSVVTIQNPWAPGSILQKYILIPNDKDVPANLPNGTIVRTPIQKALVYSAVHASIIKELGHLDIVKGVCDANYFNMPEIRQGLKDKTIIDAGAAMSPTTEKVVALAPDIIILSPYQNAGYGTLESIGVPIFESADYMESTPLGRAEWVKVYGALLCEESKADSIFTNVVTEYNKIADNMNKVSHMPKVITENEINGTWYVPGGNSYMAKLLRDAGGYYPWSTDNSTGSLSLDMPQVLDKAHDADIWLIKNAKPNYSYADLKAANPLNAQFKAFKERHILCCNTEKTTLFEDFPFHPEKLLIEYAAIFHPESYPDYKPVYFRPLR